MRHTRSEPTEPVRRPEVEVDGRWWVEGGAMEMSHRRRVEARLHMARKQCQGGHQECEREREREERREFKVIEMRIPDALRCRCRSPCRFGCGESRRTAGGPWPRARPRSPQSCTPSSTCGFGGAGVQPAQLSTHTVYTRTRTRTHAHAHNTFFPQEKGKNKEAKKEKEKGPGRRRRRRRRRIGEGERACPHESMTFARPTLSSVCGIALIYETPGLPSSGHTA